MQPLGGGQDPLGHPLRTVHPWMALSSAQTSAKATDAAELLPWK